MTFASKRLLISPSKLFYSDYVTVVQLDLPIHRQIDSSNNSNGCYILERCYSWSECCITDLEAEVAKLSLKRSRSMSHVNGKLYRKFAVSFRARGSTSTIVEQ